MEYGERRGNRAVRRTGLVALAAWLLGACACSGSAAPDRPAPLPQQGIDALVATEMQRAQIPGLAVGIVRGATTIARGYGLANIEHQVPVTPATIFQSGSLGKMFTAAAVMLLVEDGRLALSDPITKFLPDAPPAWRRITIRHLLTHTSGIPDYDDDTFDYRRDYTDADLLRLACAMRLEFAPGEKWNYSNTGYMLLGLVIGKASGRFYGDLLAERVFAPAGMRTARVISDVDIVPNRAASYELVDGAVRNQHKWVAPKLNTTADGSLYLSLQDLLAWDAVVRRRGILSASSWEQIFTPVRLNDGSSYPYGFGWDVEQRGGHALHQHSGSWQAFRTHLARFIGADLTIIVLANADQAKPGRIVDGIAGLIDPGLAPGK